MEYISCLHFVILHEQAKLSDDNVERTIKTFSNDHIKTKDFVEAFSFNVVRNDKLKEELSGTEFSEQIPITEQVKSVMNSLENFLLQSNKKFLNSIDTSSLGRERKRASLSFVVEHTDEASDEFTPAFFKESEKSCQFNPLHDSSNLAQAKAENGDHEKGFKVNGYSKSKITTDKCEQIGKITLSTLTIEVNHHKINDKKLFNRIFHQNEYAQLNNSKSNSHIMSQKFSGPGHLSQKLSKHLKRSQMSKTDQQFGKKTKYNNNQCTINQECNNITPPKLENQNKQVISSLPSSSIKTKGRSPGSLSEVPTVLASAVSSPWTPVKNHYQHGSLLVRSNGDQTLSNTMTPTRPTTPVRTPYPNTSSTEHLKSFYA